MCELNDETKKLLKKRMKQVKDGKTLTTEQLRKRLKKHWKKKRDEVTT